MRRGQTIGPGVGDCVLLPLVFLVGGAVATGSARKGDGEGAVGESIGTGGEPVTEVDPLLGAPPPPMG